MARRNVSGEGTIYRRKDGRYEGAAYVQTVSGARKRIRVYGATRLDASTKLADVRIRASQGVPAPDKNWRLGPYLDYWLDKVVRLAKRPTTYDQYEVAVRLYLKPGLGSILLNRLSVQTLQRFLNDHLAAGRSVRRVQIMRTTLSAALTRAMREQLLVHNVARLVELPPSKPKEVCPWSASEARQFLQAAAADPLFPVFVVLMLYGLRRGEALGLRRRDIDFGDQPMLRVRQQVVRAQQQLQVAEVKTRAGRRDLPLVALAADVLRRHMTAQAQIRAVVGAGWNGSDADDELIFTTRSGLPIEPRNLNRSFDRLIRQHGLRQIRLHDLRHTVNTLLKSMGVTARDRQLILGHASSATTTDVYEHDDQLGRRSSIEKIESIYTRPLVRTVTPAPDPWCLTAVVNRERCRQTLPSWPRLVADSTSYNIGGGGGIRTLDPRLMRSTLDTSNQSLTGAMLVLRSSSRQWILGRVAVKFSRQILATQPVRHPHEIWSLTSIWLSQTEKEHTPCHFE